MSPKNTTISIYLDHDLAEKLRIIAAIEGQSRSALASFVLGQFVGQDKYIPFISQLNRPIQQPQQPSEVQNVH